MSPIDRLWAWTLLAFVLHDLGWILWEPLLALPAAVFGCFVLACITKQQCDVGGGFDLAVTVAALLWLVGNLLWNFAEFVLEDEEPAGFLAHVGFLRDLDDDDYATFMWAAVGMMVASLAWFVLFCSWSCPAPSCRRWSSARERAAPDLAGPVNGDEQTKVTQQQQPTVDLLVCRVPVALYFELSLIPWIVMDSGWSWANLIDTVRGGADTSAFMCVCMLGGVAAIVLEVDCARRECADGRRDSALVYIGELFWVCGNMVWMLEDLVTGYGVADLPWAYWTAVALFGLAALASAPPILGGCCFGASCSESEEEDDDGDDGGERGSADTSSSSSSRPDE